MFLTNVPYDDHLLEEERSWARESVRLCLIDCPPLAGKGET